MKKSVTGAQASIRSSSRSENGGHSSFRWFFPTLRLMLALVFVAALAKAEILNPDYQQQNSAVMAVSGQGVGWFNLGY